MKFARSPLPSLSELKKMRERAFFDGMASAFDIMPTVRPPINLGIPVREALRSYYWAIGDSFWKALRKELERANQNQPVPAATGENQFTPKKV